MKGRTLANKIKAGLDDWQVFGSYDTPDANDERRTFITNMDRKDIKGLLRYIEVCKEMNLDYEVKSDAYDTSGTKHFFMIAFYVKGPHKEAPSKIINRILADKKKQSKEF